jgi:hypothetical protein
MLVAPLATLMTTSAGTTGAWRSTLAKPLKLVLESEPTRWRVTEAHPPNPAGFAQSGESWIVSHFWDE